MKTIDGFSFKQYLNIFQISLLAALVLSIIILSCVPPVSKDALVHHLAIPKLYLKHGRIYEIPSLKFSYYPMNLDLLYMIPLYFGNDIIPKFIHFLFGLLTAWLIFNYLKAKVNLSYALLGVLLFLSLPIIIKLSITVYVDLGVVFFSTASIIYLLKWFEKYFSFKYLLISAICCGLALGTKYNALIVLFLLTLFVAIIYMRVTHGSEHEYKHYKSLGYSAIFFLLAVLTFSPWAIRNYTWTNNPVYPLYNSWFNSRLAAPHHSIVADLNDNVADEADGIVKKTKGHWRPFEIRKALYQEKWWEIVLVPIRIFFQGQDDNPKYFDGKLNPLLFFLPLFAFFNHARSPFQVRLEIKVFLAFSILFLLFAFFERDMRIRYIAPIIPALVILSVFGLREIFLVIDARLSRPPKIFLIGLVYSILIFLLTINAAYLLGQFRYIDPLGYLKSNLDRDAYIEKYRPEYAVIKYANQNIPANAKILCLFLGNRSYYSDREMLHNYNRWLLKSVERRDSPEKILLKLKSSGITHLIVKYDSFNAWLKTLSNDKEKKIIRKLFKENLLRIYSKNGYGLFQVVFPL